MPERQQRGPGQTSPGGFIPVLWVLGGLVVGLANWLGPNLANLNRGSLFSMSPFVHYGLTVAAWFLAFAGGYLLINRLRLPFGRPAAWAHFGLMVVGTTLIIAPSVALGWTSDPVATAETISMFRLLNRVATTGYGLSLLSFAVFLCALGQSVWARMAARRG